VYGVPSSILILDPTLLAMTKSFKGMNLRTASMTRITSLFFRTLAISQVALRSVKAALGTALGIAVLSTILIIMLTIPYTYSTGTKVENAVRPK